jgi:hypothetical protein
MKIRVGPGSALFHQVFLLVRAQNSSGEIVVAVEICSVSAGAPFQGDSEALRADAKDWGGLAYGAFETLETLSQWSDGRAFSFLKPLEGLTPSA